MKVAKLFSLCFGSAPANVSVASAPVEVTSMFVAEALSRAAGWDGSPGVCMSCAAEVEMVEGAEAACDFCGAAVHCLNGLAAKFCGS
jgi:hypothetical protein